MSRSAFAVSALFCVTLAVTLAPKLALGAGKIVPDDLLLARAIVARLRLLGLPSQADLSKNGSYIVQVHTPRCRLLIQSADRFATSRFALLDAAADFGPLQYGYRGTWSAVPPARRILAETMMQGALARTGIWIARPAALALAASDGCPDVRHALDGLKAAYHRLD